MTKSILKFIKFCIVVVLGLVFVVGVYTFITGDKSYIKDFFKEELTLEMTQEEFQKMCTGVDGQLVKYAEKGNYAPNEFPLLKLKCVTKSSIYFLADD